ncbi:(4Fe-4S)-binding protein [Flavobacteriaceae bacterium AU392]|nr:(4Fe-4S)-binding protein [Flavobacteriaceae bacterium]RKM81148.1 (4Fe-4S)-binding protein [Flavobacteriaceae bacterium AU392]
METKVNTTYSNKKITVSFEPCKCIHAEICANELSDVFRSSVIPWINLEGANYKRIIKQVKRCPSGALQYQLNNNKA